MFSSKLHRPSKPRLSAFARDLLAEWQRLELPVSKASVVVAVSGGADSTALLLGLDELTRRGKLRLKLIVAHLDHGLRENSKRDAQWVSALAKDLKLDIVVGRARLKTLGSKTKTSKSGENLEQAARKARYDFLQKTAGKIDSEYVLTAHTLDDQAETILLRLLRGSAAEGLSGTPSIRTLQRGSKVKLIRPLLTWARRRDTEGYCRLRDVDFRFDEMNDDETFSRVRIRKQLLPLMKSFNNRVVEALSRTASLLHEDAVALAAEANRLLELAAQNPEKPRSPIIREGSVPRQSKALANARASAWVATHGETNSPSLSVSVLLQSPAAVRRRALREWILQSRGNLNRVEMVHLVAVEKLLSGERGGRVAELPDGMMVTRRRGMLELSNKKRLKKTPRGL
ncbi:MAG TPA: tRNA lysidine(34) synthetase TilS [Pyrinomonadaceae bacterium]|jgi:tRNA(Ile)-lysidine synthase|nr:tRNA lysidine(34) synthetase TilS [Pyrinomonadaceae bacterium]